MHTKEPVNNVHEVNLVMGAQDTAEESLHSRIFVEVNKIVNIEPERERGADNEALGGSSGSTRQPMN